MQSYEHRAGGVANSTLHFHKWLTLVLETYVEFSGYSIDVWKEAILRIAVIAELDLDFYKVFRKEELRRFAVQSDGHWGLCSESLNHFALTLCPSSDERFLPEVFSHQQSNNANIVVCCRTFVCVSSRDAPVPFPGISTCTRLPAYQSAIGASPILRKLKKRSCSILDNHLN